MNSNPREIADALIEAYNASGREGAITALRTFMPLPPDIYTEAMMLFEQGVLSDAT